jgi:gentisate 1,2-dioxygenase
MMRHAAALAASATAQGALDAMMTEGGFENGWSKAEPSLWPHPRKSFLPAHWSYAEAAAVLDAAGPVVSTALAERRNLILANPMPGNRYATVRTLVSAYQMVKAGETARSHRHSANALRLVLDAEPGMYTIVAGKRIPMQPGDVLLTPNWLWHGHSNESGAAGYWLDFLDVPLVHLLGPMFFEHHPDGIEREAPVDAASPMRFAWEAIRARLDAEYDKAPGRREIELGDPALATISLHVIRLARGKAFRTEPTTANAIFAVMDGEGASDVDERGFVWRRGDVVAVPSGSAMTCRVSADSHLLRVSDARLFADLDWLRAVPAGA